jgi:hypothetical protein
MLPEASAFIQQVSPGERKRNKREKDTGRGALQVWDGSGVVSNREAGQERRCTRRRVGGRERKREKIAGRKIRRLNGSSPL